MSAFMLTTSDNPFDPFNQYDEWRAFDEGKGYFTNEYLARIALISPEMTDEMIDDEFNRAIDEICEYNILGIYEKVTEDDYKDGRWKAISLKEET